MAQNRPVRWPAGRLVDWLDPYERRTWVAELRDQIFDLFVTALDATRAPLRGLSRGATRKSLLATKESIDKLMAVAGAPLEVWREVRIPLPATNSYKPPEQVGIRPDPFEEVLRGGYSDREQAKWLLYVEGQIEYLLALALAAYPKASFEYRRARWTAIRLRVLLDKMYVKLGLPSR